MALLAVFCMSAVVASSALAGVKKAEIVTASGGSLTKTKFKATSGSTVLETVSGSKVTCNSDTAVGSVLTRTSATQTVTFKECKASIGTKCKGGNAGTAAEGEIKIGGVLVDAVWLTTGKTTLGLLDKVPGTFSFKCGEVTNEVKNSFVTGVGAAQEETAKTLFTFTAKTKGTGEQELTEYELTDEAGIKTTTLESKLAGSAAFEQSSEAGTEDIEFEESIKFI